LKKKSGARKSLVGEGVRGLGLGKGGYVLKTSPAQNAPRKVYLLLGTSSKAQKRKSIRSGGKIQYPRPEGIETFLNDCPGDKEDFSS